MRRSQEGVWALVLLLLTAEARPARAAAVDTFSLQGGWWSVEGELKLRFGVYAALV
ncbi:MAG: hypothetical protein JXP73_05410 [Deltaproteobacteria bacterium]|nr:hypothetical protein [Deltaproteobacteria bacterium]